MSSSMPVALVTGLERIWIDAGTSHSHGGDIRLPHRMHGTGVPARRFARLMAR
jgi:hypothetical protein